MKRLTQVRLIHWYHIIDETLPIHGSALFMGDNGSGKSTILDAIQFALVADLTQVKFNQAANENAARSLQGYTRWMTNASGGKETYQYNRGDCSSYVLLQFEEELADGTHAFVVGAVIDSFKDGRDPKRLHFALNQARIDDIPVFQEGKKLLLTSSEFRKLMTPRKGFFSSSEPGPFRDDLLVRLGKLSPEFTKILVKAQAFKPLGQVQQFVTDFLLDPRPLDTQSLQANLSSYKALEQKSIEADKRVSQLEKLSEKAAELKRLADEIRSHHYLEVRSEAGVLEKKIEVRRTEEEACRLRKEGTESELRLIDDSLRQCDLEIGSIYRALSQDSAYQERERTLLEIKRCESELESIERRLAESKQALVQLERIRDNLPDGGEGSFRDRSIQARVQKDQIQSELNALKKEGEELQERLSNLEKGARNYSPEVRALKGLIEDQIGCDAPLFCELLEVRDEKWQAAVEGYLNTRRFDIVIDPKYFQKSLSLYEKMKRQLQIHGVGLVDAEKVMAAARTPKTGSLAEQVSGSNDWAQAYAEFILGDVIRCESEKELRKHSRSITPTCMVYQNHAARQTPFHVFDTWYIGARGHAQQLVRTQERIAKLHGDFTERAESIQQLHRIIEQLEKAEKLEVIAQELNALQENLKILAQEKARLAAHLATLKNERLESLEQSLTRLRAERDTLGLKRDQCLKSIAAAEQLIATLRQQQRDEETLRDFAFGRIHQEFGMETSEYESRYHEELAGGRPPEKIQEVYSHQKRNCEGRRFSLLEKLTIIRSDYNNAFGFSGPVEGEDLRPYLDELLLWRESLLPEYRQKIALAKDAALQQLMEDIIHKLRENLDMIPEQFEQINRALRGFHFGYDQYQFSYRVKREYQAFEKLIREAAEYERQPLFETSWRERFRDGGALEALFESLISGSSAQVSEELGHYSDYREYYEYDLRILHADGTESMFSQVNRWKSGGETQAPYYIAVLASLYRLYRLRPDAAGKQRGTIGLVILDEAFNKMDEDRLSATLQFTKRLGLQLLMATPKERAEFIIPHVESCWIVGKDPMSGHAYLHDFHQQLELPS
jgi:energy-coupling factor transporter ATP-binding protein EcfA2